MSSLMRFAGGDLAFQCAPTECSAIDERTLGFSTFHCHTAALAVARHDNKKVGRKIMKVVVRGDHFVVVRA